MKIYLYATIYFIVGLLIGILVLIVKVEPNFINSKLSDWISSLSSLVVSIFTIMLYMTAKKTAVSWREQREPEAVKKIIKSLISFSQLSFRLKQQKNITQNDFQNYRDKFEEIEPSLIYLFHFTEESRTEIENLYREMWISINNIQDYVFNNANDSKKLIGNVIIPCLEKSEKLIKFIAKKNAINIK